MISEIWWLNRLFRAVGSSCQDVRVNLISAVITWCRHRYHQRGSKRVFLRCDRDCALILGHINYSVFPVSTNVFSKGPMFLWFLVLSHNGNTRQDPTFPEGYFLGGLFDPAGRLRLAHVREYKWTKIGVTRWMLDVVQDVSHAELGFLVCCQLSLRLHW